MNLVNKTLCLGAIGLFVFSLGNLNAVSKPDLKLIKLHHVRNLDKKNTGGNEALEFEHRYWDHGAASHREMHNRRGEIFVFVWRNDGIPITGEAIFSYRQAHTRDMIKTIRIPIKEASGTQRSLISVIGENYFKDGPLHSWLFEIRAADGKVHLREKSFIW
jgi:hypothetical protein